MSDLEFCQLLHRLSDAPIVAIGSCIDDAFRIGMLEAMMIDYLVRPFSVRELAARVRNVLRLIKGPRVELRGSDPLHSRMLHSY